jgi:hypothetical protein
MPDRPFIPVPNTSQVELIYSAGAYSLENVLHVHKGSPYSLADLQAQRAVFDTWDNTYWKLGRPSFVSLARIHSKALDTDTAPFEDYSLSSPRAGSNGGGFMTLAPTFAVKLTSGFSGRSARGRIYVPGLTESMMADGYGNVTSGQANNWVSYVNSLITALTAAGYTLCITSYRHDKTWRTEGVNYDVTAVSYTDLHADVQRRRMPGRGSS